MENLPKHAWILCVRHNLLLVELCALRARCLLFQMLSIIVSTPSGSFKADRLYLFILLFCVFSTGVSSKARFQEAWLSNADFQPWLDRVDGNPSKAFCKTCKRTIGAEITSIKRHKTTKLHTTTESEERERVLEDEEEDVPQSIDGVAQATVLFASFIAEHNLPFSIADHLVELHMKMFPDSVIAQELFLKRTKCTEIVKSLGNSVINDVVCKLRKNKFSVIIDETTDISTMKCCAVNVRFFDQEAGKVTTAMLDLFNVYENGDEGSTGENLYNMLMRCLRSRDIPLDHSIGFAADGAANIMGNRNSLSSRLKENLPGITIMKCICHSLHLCASEAAKSLPCHCEDLIRNIYSFFSHSAKRLHEFREFQSFCQTKPHKILHVSQTRWLSLHEAVARVVEQWRPLTLYFSGKVAEERLLSVQQISDKLQDPTMLCYFNFLDFILPKVNNCNKLFQKQQSNNPLVAW